MIKNSKILKTLLTNVCLTASLAFIPNGNATAMIEITGNNLDKIETEENKNIWDVEFSKRSVIEYAKSRGIDFDKSKNTLGKHIALKTNRLESLVNDLCRRLNLDLRTKKALATMLFQTDIAGSEIPFAGAVSEIAQAACLLEAVESIENGKSWIRTNDEKKRYDELIGKLSKSDTLLKMREKGLDYLRGFISYHMIINTNIFHKCFRVEDNFENVWTEKLGDLIDKNFQTFLRSVQGTINNLTDFIDLTQDEKEIIKYTCRDAGVKFLLEPNKGVVRQCILDSIKELFREDQGIEESVHKGLITTLEYCKNNSSDPLVSKRFEQAKDFCTELTNLKGKIAYLQKSRTTKNNFSNFQKDSNIKDVVLKLNFGKENDNFYPDRMLFIIRGMRGLKDENFITSQGKITIKSERLIKVLRNDYRSFINQFRVPTYLLSKDVKEKNIKDFVRDMGGAHCPWIEDYAQQIFSKYGLDMEGSNKFEYNINYHSYRAFDEYLESLKLTSLFEQSDLHRLKSSFLSRELFEDIYDVYGELLGISDDLNKEVIQMDLDKEIPFGCNDDNRDVIEDPLPVNLSSFTLKKGLFKNKRAFWYLWVKNYIFEQGIHPMLLGASTDAPRPTFSWTKDGWLKEVLLTGTWEELLKRIKDRLAQLKLIFVDGDGQEKYTYESNTSQSLEMQRLFDQFKRLQSGALQRDIKEQFKQNLVPSFFEYYDETVNG